MMLLAMWAVVVSPTFAANKQMFSFTYTKVTYSCKQANGRSKQVAVYSQVFGMCYQDGVSHIAYAKNTQSRSAEQAATALCDGTLSVPSTSGGVPYQGHNSEATPAEKGRQDDITGAVKAGATTGSYFVVAPYSANCE